MNVNPFVGPCIGGPLHGQTKKGLYPVSKFYWLNPKAAMPWGQEFESSTLVNAAFYSWDGNAWRFWGHA